ncbi:hypothetical protein P9B97_02360 [Bacillus paralicheniformis]|uniref:hypothetical protein n=1 Tax=Bacillus paralicheniformis TaxID=1648923 RepID=UPI002DBF2B80|nr:hypothetical protein [Bacillus paralicheniformis]MEC1050925.1 hypothetical protein [Bacillus paralicheniformis]MEC1085043.1 hypothetical protein [Bacillus paralicheniformis]MEC1108843.1 hypothetical protein [Bacillus paralicheniformis]MEC1137179.1 hypothetical protein [Bacillus paralicheniformis]MEC1148066.1 hypothetical protein [Bacillus paralicheniformis]
MKNLKHLKKIKRQILYSVVWRVAFLVLCPILINLISLFMPLSLGIMVTNSFIISLLFCISLTRHFRNLIDINTALKEYKHIENVLKDYSMDIETGDKLLDNTLAKYDLMLNFKKTYDIDKLHELKDLLNEPTQLISLIFPDEHTESQEKEKEKKMAAVFLIASKNAAERALYSIFDSRSPFGSKGRIYFDKWNIARQYDNFVKRVGNEK